MARSDVAAVCRATGLPFAYRVFPDGYGEIPYPHLRYQRSGADYLHADDRAYAKADEWSILLVSETKDDAAEAAVEAAMDAAGIAYSAPYEDYIDEERLWQVTWDFILPR